MASLHLIEYCILRRTQHIEAAKLRGPTAFYEAQTFSLNNLLDTIWL